MHACVQGTSDPPQPSMISASTSDPLWRSIRRGVAPAFSTDNIRRHPGRVGLCLGWRARAAGVFLQLFTSK
jgi:hypothetical protein